MTGLFRFLIDQFYTNQFMTAAVVAAPMTALVYTARNLPVRIWQLLRRQLTTQIGFNSDIPDYLSAHEFVAREVVSERFSRSFLYSSEMKWDRGEEVVEHRGLTLGYGVHIGFWRGRIVWIERELEQGQQTEKFKERLRLTFLTRRRQILSEFAALVRAHHERAIEGDYVSLWINGESYWKIACKLPARSLSTVFTARGEAGRLLNHLRDFERKKGWYRARGLPYHTGVLLTGEPGTGKTSLIHAIASEMGRSLHYLNLGSVENDRQLTDLVSSGRGWERSILVIEDADATRADVSREAPVADGQERSPLTLSAMLNLLDGLLTPDGMVVIATSNHPERLDPALIRPGRFDLSLEIGRLDWTAFVSMAEVFGAPLRSDDPRRFGFVEQPGATLRAKLLAGGVDAVLGGTELQP